MKISEKFNGRILEKWLKFPSSRSDQRNRLLNFTPSFFRRFKDLEPMLSKSGKFVKEKKHDPCSPLAVTRNCSGFHNTFQRVYYRHIYAK